MIAALCSPVSTSYMRAHTLALKYLSRKMAVEFHRFRTDIVIEKAQQNKLMLSSDIMPRNWNMALCGLTMRTHGIGLLLRKGDAPF